MSYFELWVAADKRAEALAAEVVRRGPRLGWATTRELLEEIKARGELEPAYVIIGGDMATGAANLLEQLPGSMLDYSTVKGDQSPVPGNGPRRPGGASIPYAAEARSTAWHEPMCGWPPGGRRVVVDDPDVLPALTVAEQLEVPRHG